MKKVLLALLILFTATTVEAQSSKMQYDGATDIRAISGNYFIYFRLADMKEAFLELPQPVQQRYAEFMDLPIGIRATINLIQGSKAQASIMERVLFRHTAGYLLKKGLAYIETKDGKKVEMLTWSEEQAFKDEAGFDVRRITFYDQATHKAVFSGTIDNVFK